MNGTDGRPPLLRRLVERRIALPKSVTEDDRLCRLFLRFRGEASSAVAPTPLMLLPPWLLLTLW